MDENFAPNRPAKIYTGWLKPSTLAVAFAKMFNALMDAGDDEMVEITNDMQATMDELVRTNGLKPYVVFADDEGNRLDPDDPDLE